MPILELLPHELPPGSPAPLAAEADLVTEWHEKEVLVRKVKLYRGVDVLFVRYEGYNSPLCKMPLFGRGLLLWPRQRKISVGGHLGGVRAQIYFCPDVPEGVLVWPDGEAAWLSRKGKYATRFLCKLPNTQDVQVLSRALVEARQRENSDAAFAWNWSRMSDAEKNCFVWGTVADDFERVMTWALQSTPELWNQTKRCVLFMPLAGGLEGMQVFDSDERDLEDFLFPLQEWWRFWMKRLPISPQHLARKHMCVRWMTKDVQGECVDCYCVAETPTSHEQLEARVQLQKWLEENVAPEERAALMPPA